MASITSVSQDLSGRDLGPYRLERPLGEGAGARVYLARHRNLERSAALKVVDLAALDPAARARFRRELKAAAKVEHTGVVRAFASGEEGELAWLALEHLEGETLAARLEAGPLPREQALRLCAALARALSAVHAAGLVHRDVKPENVVLRGDGSPVLIDFGLAQLSESSQRIEGAPSDGQSAALTRPGTLLGTPLYAAPEQIGIGPEGVDGRADVYALGCLLHWLLCGRVPHDTGDRDLRAFLARRRAEDPALDPTLSPALQALLGRALARDPAARPDAAALADELERQVAGDAAPARTEPRAVPVPVTAAPSPSRPEASSPEVASPGVPSSPRLPLRWGAAALLILLLGLGALARRDARTPPPAPSPATTPAADPTPTLEPTPALDPTPATTSPPTPTPTPEAAPEPARDAVDEVLAALEGLDLALAARRLDEAASPSPELQAAARLLRVLQQLNGDEPLVAVSGFERVASQAPRTWALIQRLEPELTTHALARAAAERGNLLGVAHAFQQRQRAGARGDARHLLPARAQELELLERLAQLTKRAMLFPGPAADELARLRTSPLGGLPLGRRIDPTLAEVQARWEARARRR
mgnify:CR=1 FL=1